MQKYFFRKYNVIFSMSIGFNNQDGLPPPRLDQFFRSCAGGFIEDRIS